MTKQDVPISDDRDGHSLCDFGDGRPVGRRAIPGAARPAMDDERVGAGVHDGARLVQVVARLVIPSEANLCGDRDGDGCLDGRHETALPCRLASQRGPEAFVCEVVDGTAAIEIDQASPA